MTEQTMVAPHVQRMIDECGELLKRVEKLATFLTGAIYPTLPEEDQTLLAAQYAAMNAYLQILSLCIARAIAGN